MAELAEQKFKSPVPEVFRYVVLAGLMILPVLTYIALQFIKPEELFGLVFLIAIFLIGIISFRTGLFSLIVFLPLEPLALKIIPDNFILFFRLVPETLIAALFVSGLFVYFTKLQKGNVKFKGWRDPILLPVLFLAFLSLISSLLNLVHPVNALFGFRQVFRFIFLYEAVIFHGLAMAQILAIIAVVASLAGFESILGIIQAIGGERVDALLRTGEELFAGDVRISQDIVQVREAGRRVFATMGRYDQLGTFLALVGSASLGFIYQGTQKAKRLVGLLLLFLIPTLLLTYSRASWFGFLLAVLAVAVFIKRDKKVIAGFLLVAVVIAGYTISREIQIRKLLDNPEITPVTRLLEAFSEKRWKAEYRDKGRIFFLAETPKALWPNYFLFGVGPGQYGGGAAALLHNTIAYDKLNLPFGVYTTEGMIDSNWMSILGELGILGFLAYLSLFILLLIHAYRILKDERAGWLSKSLALGLIGATVSFAFQGWLGTHFEVRTLAPYYWLLAALTITAYRYESTSYQQI